MSLPGHFETLFEKSPLFFCILDRDLRYIYTNPAHRALFSGRDLTGFTVYEAQPELEGTEYIEMLMKVLNEGQNFEVKASPLQIKDSVAYIDMIYAPQVDDSGKIIGLFAMGSDVTQEILTRKKLEESENLLKVIANKVPAYVSYTDSEGRYKFLNDVYAQWFGSNPEKFLGKTRSDIIPPGYRATAANFEGKAEKDGSSYHEVILERPDGKAINLEVSYFADKDEEGNHKGIVAVGIDVTEKLARIRELDRTRKNLRDVFDQTPFPMCVLTKDDLRFEMANPSYEAFIGKKAEGRTLKEVFEGDDISLYEKIIDEVFRTGKPFSIHEAPLVSTSADGVTSKRVIDAHYHPFPG